MKHLHHTVVVWVSVIAVFLAGAFLFISCRMMVAQVGQISDGITGKLSSASSNDYTITKVDEETNLYTNTKYGFSFEYPSKYKKVGDIYSYATFMLHKYIENYGMSPREAISVQVYSDIKSINEIVKQYEYEINDNGIFNEVLILTEDRGDLLIYEIKERGDASGAFIHSDILFIDKNRNIGVALDVFNVGKQEDNIPQIKTLKETFKFSVF